jgi:hypothetical protein
MALTLAEVRQRIEEIEGELAALKAEGEILRGFWIDSTGGGKYKYYRLRWYCGQDEETGKDLSYGSRTLQPGEVASMRAAIERGGRVQELEKELVVVRAELARKEALARELGFYG